MRPMLATSGEPRSPAARTGSHEIKWDGMRVLADVRDGRLTPAPRATRTTSPPASPSSPGSARCSPTCCWTARSWPWTAASPRSARWPSACTCTTRRRAAALAATRPVTYMVFDLLRLYGVDLTGRPLAERRATLERLDAAAARFWQVPPTYDDGPVLQEATLEQGLEGVVSKRLASPTAGPAQPDWVKFAAPARRRRCVVGGWRPRGRTATHRLGALLVGAPTADGLRYLGRVGSGHRRTGAGRGCWRRWRRWPADASPFADAVPRVDATGTAWVRAAGRGGRQGAGTVLRRTAAAAVVRGAASGPGPGRPAREGVRRRGADRRA